MRINIRSELNKLIKTALKSNFGNVTNANGEHLFLIDGSINAEVSTVMAETGGYRQVGEQPYGLAAYRALLVETRGPFEPSSNTPSAVIDYLPAAHLAYVESAVSSHILLVLL